MKTLRLSSAAILCTAAMALVAAQPARAADPFGIWVTQDGKGQVRMVNCGGALCGTLIWLKEPNDPDTGQPKLDKHNVDASKQSRPLLGIPIVLDMKPASANEWDGHVYNAEDGNTYTGSFTMTSEKTAALKGCVMGGLICKAQSWTKVK